MAIPFIAARVAAGGARAAAGRAVKGAVKSKFATRAAQGLLGQIDGGSDVRTAVSRSLTGRAYQGGRGYTALPMRTQAQASTFGIAGDMPKTELSGFGALNLDRGFRPVMRGHMASEPIHGDEQETSPQAPERQTVVPPIRATATYKGGPGWMDNDQWRRAGGTTREL